MSDKIKEAIAFARCAIKCGEPYTPTCDKVFDAAFEELKQLYTSNHDLGVEVEEQAEELRRLRPLVSEVERLEGDKVGLTHLLHNVAVFGTPSDFALDAARKYLDEHQKPKA